MIDWLIKNVVWKTPERAISIYRHVPKSYCDSMRLQSLRNTLKHVSNKSIFYSQLFERFPLDFEKITEPAEIGDLFTTPKDLYERPLSHFVCSRADTAFETTGTLSKSPKRILFSNDEIDDIGRIGAAGLWHLGLRKEDRVASSFDYSFWVSGPTLKSSLKFLGAFHIEAGRIDPEEFYERIKPYGCNVIVADPGWLVRLSEIAEKRGPWLMKLMIIGGENLRESSRKFIEDVWQCKTLLSYGQTEAFGSIGIECHLQKGYHVNDMDLWPEIINPDKDGYGELVYTTLRRSVMPLVRYKSGDITKLMTEECGCGLPSYRLAKLKGRKDEMVVTGVGNIASWMVESMVNKIESPLHEWQLGVISGQDRDRLEFRAEAQDEVSRNQLKTELMQSMESTMSVAFEGIQRGMAEFDVKVVKPGVLKGEGRKIKKILDERNDF